MPPIEYEQYAALVRQIARHYATKYRVDIEDLISEGNLAYMEAIKGFDPSRGNAFTTYLWPKLIYRISRIANPRERKGFSPQGLELTELDSELWTQNNQAHLEYSGEHRRTIRPEEIIQAHQEEEADFRQMLVLLSEEAQDVVKTVFNCPAELVEMACENTCKITKDLLKRYFRQKGWSKSVVELTFLEIRAGLREIG